MKPSFAAELSTLMIKYGFDPPQKGEINWEEPVLNFIKYLDEHTMLEADINEIKELEKINDITPTIDLKDWPEFVERTLELLLLQRKELIFKRNVYVEKPFYLYRFWLHKHVRTIDNLIDNVDSDISYFRSFLK
jgi:hypothetical protein